MTKRKAITSRRVLAKKDEPKTWQNILTWGTFAVLTVLSVFILYNLPENAGVPNDLTHILAWGVSGFLMAIIAWGTPMFLLGGVRRSPLQSWMMPHVQLVKDVSLRVKHKLETGKSLTEGEYGFVGNLSQHIALRIAGVAFFAGLMLLRF